MSPNVLLAIVLFTLLSPGLLVALPPGSGRVVQTATHAVVFSLISYVILKYILKRNVTRADIVVPAILFLTLTPGVVLSGSLGVRAVIFTIIYASLRTKFPQAY